MADINLTAEQVAALILSIGDKSKLKTEQKQTLVDAINNVLDMRVNPDRISDLLRQFESKLSEIYDSDLPAVPYVDNFTTFPIQTLAVERTSEEEDEAEEQEIYVLNVPSIGKMRQEIKAPLIIKGAITPVGGSDEYVFTPETDYTSQEIYDAFMDGRDVKVYVTSGAPGIIAPLVIAAPSYAFFQHLSLNDPQDINDGFDFLKLSRVVNGWEAAYKTV